MLQTGDKARGSATGFSHVVIYILLKFSNFSVKVDWCLEGICKVLHENVKGLQFPKTHNNF